MGRKRDADRKRHVTGKEDAVFLDDWLDEPEDDYIDFEGKGGLFVGGTSCFYHGR